jgi:hypothetical protein
MKFFLSNLYHENILKLIIPIIIVAVIEAVALTELAAQAKVSIAICKIIIQNI